MAKQNNDHEEALRRYAEEQESIAAQTGKKVNPPIPGYTDTPSEQPKKPTPRNIVDGGAAPTQSLQEQARQHLADQVPLQEAQREVNEDLITQSRQRGAGFLPVDIQDLPSQGLFYPDGIKIFIRAANTGEIKHWSMIDETAYDNIDESLNYVLERCMTISMPDGTRGQWKDLKDIDRFYLILAIRDFTFTDGNNELKIKVSESKDVVVHKDNIDFIKIDPKLMKHYSPVERCFVFSSPKLAKGSLRIYMPSVGVTKWLKDYYQKKKRRQEQIDEDFFSIAPMLIKDWKGLNDAAYEGFVVSSLTYSPYEYSLIAKVKELLAGAIQPQFTYTDEDGAEQTSPLNFRGGLKSIFLVEVDDLL